MKIPYNKIRTFSTSELPGVLCDPQLVFEFLAAPTYEQMQSLTEWATGNITQSETVRLASQIIIAVIVPDGERYPLGNIEAINEFIKQTDYLFVVNLLKGWQTRIALERMTELKNFKASSVVSIAGDANKTLASE